MIIVIRCVLAALALAACSGADAANDRFFKEAPGSMNGFMPATDPLYRKECGACHTAYLPGLFPARSWQLHMDLLHKHFGENVALKDADRDAILKYLVENAADRSKYEGSLTMMERVEAKQTPYRFMDMALFREMHRIVLAVIERKTKVKVRRLTNCGDCHQAAEEGSFGNDELLIPGLTPTRKQYRTPVK